MRPLRSFLPRRVPSRAVWGVAVALCLAFFIKEGLVDYVGIRTTPALVERATVKLLCKAIEDFKRDTGSLPDTSRSVRAQLTGDNSISQQFINDHNNLFVDRYGAPFRFMLVDDQIAIMNSRGDFIRGCR